MVFGINNKLIANFLSEEESEPRRSSKINELAVLMFQLRLGEIVLKFLHACGESIREQGKRSNEEYKIHEIKVSIEKSEEESTQRRQNELKKSLEEFILKQAINDKLESSHKLSQ